MSRVILTLVAPATDPLQTLGVGTGGGGGGGGGGPAVESWTYLAALLYCM